MGFRFLAVLSIVGLMAVNTYAQTCTTTKEQSWPASDAYNIVDPAWDLRPPSLADWVLPPALSSFANILDDSDAGDLVRVNNGLCTRAELTMLQSLVPYNPQACGTNQGTDATMSPPQVASYALSGAIARGACDGGYYALNPTATAGSATGNSMTLDHSTCTTSGGGAVTLQYYACPAGMYCPQGYSCAVPCSKGASCSITTPTAKGYPTVVNGETFDCECNTAAPESEPGCGGNRHNLFCPGGYYCPNPWERTRCPEGYYCRPGHTDKVKCIIMSHCPEGTTYPIYYGIWIVLVILVLLVIAAYKGYIWNWNKEHDHSKAKSQAGQATKQLKDEGADGLKEEDIDSGINSGDLLRAEKTYGKLKWSELDGDDDGDIEMEDIQRMMGTGFHPERAKKLFEAMDADHDGHVDMEEFKAMQAARMSTSGMMPSDGEATVAGVGFDLEEASSLSSIKKKNFTIDFKFDELTLTLNSIPKQVLSGVTGQIEAGQVTAIMGPSGAGKTTFLSTLSGKAYYGKTDGKVLINGKVASISEYKQVVGFVPQEDTMHRNLTVMENLEFYAALRLPATYTNAERTKIVEETVQVLGIWDVRDIKIGDAETRGISGGQRKRVNIGMELVADPTVLFLDEPTSGLDSTSSFEVLEALGEVAGLGINIIVVLHQPQYRIFMMFDKVLLLGKGGKTVYIGETGKAAEYFNEIGFECPGDMNPADFYMDVIAGLVPCTKDRTVKKDDGEEVTIKGADFNFKKDLFLFWDDFQAQRPQPEHVDYDALPPYQLRNLPGLWSQFVLCYCRYNLQQVRSPTKFSTDVALTFVAGLAIGNMFMEPLPGDYITICLLSCMSIGFCTGIASLNNFGAERVIYWREAAMGISRESYFIGKNISDLPKLFIFIPLAFLCMFYPMTNPNGYFSEYFLIFLSTTYACSGFSYLISTFITPKSSQLCVVVFTLLSCMVGGANPTLVQLDKSGFIAQICYSCSFARYTMEAMFIVNVNGLPDVWEGWRSSQLAATGYDKDNLGFDIGMLFLMGTLARVLSLICLYQVNKGAQT